MKKLTVKKIQTCPTDAKQVPEALDAEGVLFQSIDVVNWDAYPYSPSVRFRIAHTADAILLHYQVEEEMVRGKYTEDNGSVWTDACAEFFIAPTDDGYYYNIETNCIGTVLVGAGLGRGNREHAPLELLARVKRWASLGREACVQEGPVRWELALIIPYEVFFRSDVKCLDGQTVRGNFYKCGDELKTPHFLSWNPIAVPSPDFHRPEAFGELYFE